MLATWPSTAANSMSPNSSCAITNTYSPLERGRGRSPVNVESGLVEEDKGLVLRARPLECAERVSEGRERSFSLGEGLSVRCVLVVASLP